VSLVFLTGGDGDLHRAKNRDFDSTFALSQARAISYDASADEFRYLVAPSDRSQFDQAFLNKSQQIASLSGVDARHYGNAIGQAQSVYHYSGHAVWFHGYLGTEFGTVRSADEEVAAGHVLDHYVAYEQDHDRMRALVASGDLRSAITLTTRSVSPGGKFGDYGQSLDALIRLKQSLFGEHVRSGESALAPWSVVPWLAVIVVIGLTAAGVRPRLREYHS
jgi:hypothetical protein